LQWPIVHQRIVDVCLGLSSIRLPAYVLLEIVDWFPYWYLLDHSKKIKLIIDVNRSISKILKF